MFLGDSKISAFSFAFHYFSVPLHPILTKGVSVATG